jgi:hypothetical protein
METIHAAHNLTIEFSPTTWRLVNGSRLPDQPNTRLALIEAQSLGLACAPAFARTRQLLSDRLAPADVARIVVGWAPESHNWHLGLLLAARPETNYQTRWCGLATWPSGPAAESADAAAQAGQSLAQIIDRPFYLVPPPLEHRAPLISDTQPLQPTQRLDVPAVEPVRPAVAPKLPPFEFEQVALLPAPRGYVWQKRRAWLVTTVGKMVGLLVLAGLFLLLGIGSQTAGLAPVTPEWLPWLGLVVAGLLVTMSLVAFKGLLDTSDILVDTTMRELRGQRRFDGRVRWRIPFESAMYLLISQTPARPLGHVSQEGTQRFAQDVWLHLYDGTKFWPLVELRNVEGESHQWEAVRTHAKQRRRRPLLLAEYDTPAHHAARLMATIIETESWLDIR